ncbi:MAG: hypothetical protein M5R42_20580 [Rhodocyclaceae bacterium]|nr:hypothetical protein [Rhodocyclaceae bacterium]
MSKRERISPVDTAWLRMDRPTNLMMIVGVMMFAGAMDYERLRRTLEARLLPYRRFRQKVEHDATGAYWVDDEDFDLDRHLHHAALPAGDHKVELQKMVADLMSIPLDPNRPLWSYHLVDNYDGGSALIVRIHHCIADGIALIGVMLSLTDASPDAPERPGPPLKMARGEEGPDSFFWNRVFEPVTQGMITAYNLSTKAWLKYFELLTHPGQALDYSRQGVGMAAELANLLIMPADSQTRFRGKPGGTKAVAWAEPMPLNEVKAVGKALGCSVNDLLLSAVAGALRAYLVEQGDPIEGVEVRAMVPVNMRSKEDEGKLGNRFGLVTLLLPVYIENPFERTFEVRRRMDELKGVLSAGRRPRRARRHRPGAEVRAGHRPRHPRQQGLGGHDQCARPAAAPIYGGIAPGTADVLGAAKRQHRHGRLHPQLRRQGVQFGLVTDRHFAADPGEHRLPFLHGIREAGLCPAAGSMGRSALAGGDTAKPGRRTCRVCRCAQGRKTGRQAPQTAPAAKREGGCQVAAQPPSPAASPPAPANENVIAGSPPPSSGD